MSEIMVRERFLRSGKKVYEYSFEMASVDGKRKRKSKSGFASKRDARIAGRKALSEYENVGQVMVDRDISYADFLDLWMENDCKLTCKESTLYGYEKKIRLYLKPELGGYRVSSIDKKILQTFITDLYNDGFSINTIISIKGLLTKSFNYALENHYIMTSPANKLVIPQNMQPDKPTRRKEHIYLTKDNIDSLFERFPKGTSSFVPLQIAYHTGMRPGEVFGLVWDDIDFDNKVINVNRQIQWRQVKRSKKDIKKTNGTSESLGYWYFTSPKYKSYRVIDIDDVLVSILKEEYEKQNAISGNISTTTKDYIINYQDMQGLGMTGNLALPTLIAISSAALSKPPISSLAVLGEISIGGTLIKVEDLASTLQVCIDSGAKKVLLPITSAADLGTVPSDLVGAFSLIFYSSPEEAVYKALGVE